MKNGSFNFNYKWKFKLVEKFPLMSVLEDTRDSSGHYFYEQDYNEDDWKDVSLPHTFNDDIFVNRIEDAGSGQRRCFGLYRKWIEPVDKLQLRTVFLEFEGVRQTAYVYVNGHLAGYLESGVQPFGLNISAYLYEDRDNLIAIATDNTCTRNIDWISAETPNYEGAVPGTFVSPQNPEGIIPAGCQKGINYFWNCNDFNPTVGGLTRNIRLHVKPKCYLTLPLYSNLKTMGTYVYADEFNTKTGAMRLNVEAGVINDLGEAKNLSIEVLLLDEENNLVAPRENRVFSETIVSGKAEKTPVFKTIIPKEAYIKTQEGFKEAAEDSYALETEILEDAVLKHSLRFDNIKLWSISQPALYTVWVKLYVNGEEWDSVKIQTGFRKVTYDGENGLRINDEKVWLRGYAQRATNEWAAIGCAPDWLKDYDAMLIRESNANHIRFMHVAGSPADIRAYDRYGVVCTQPAGDKERENFNRQWMQRLEAMRDITIYFRNSPSILFWEAGNNSINALHMRQMRRIKEKFDPNGGRFAGCRTINTDDVLSEAEYVGTMLNRHAASFMAKTMPITETEYLRDESPRRVWDDYTPPDYDYDNRYVGPGGKKIKGTDTYDLTAEDFAKVSAAGYKEFFNDRMGGASGRNLYTATAALCWTDSCQHGRQSYSENARMSGRVDAVRVKKQSFDVFRVMQSQTPKILILGHFNYPKKTKDNYKYALKSFNGTFYEPNGEFAYRDPQDKTVYVIGSYQIAAVSLYINGIKRGYCDKPDNTFIFAFEHIDITEQGTISAIGYDYEGREAAHYSIETAGEPAEIELKLNCSEAGFVADGQDIAYVDVRVVDKEGRTCPICYDRIDFSLEGNAEFLGGYNSGKFLSPEGVDNSVIHKPYVFAECGTNRVFIRAGHNSSKLKLTAGMYEGKIKTTIHFESLDFKEESISENRPARHGDSARALLKETGGYIDPIPMADAVKYVKKDKVTCKVLVNGQEPNTYGNLSIVMNDSVFSPVVPIFEAMHRGRPEAFDMTYEDGTLTISSKGHTVVARVGYTHMKVDDGEILMGGQPFINENGFFMMEINAIAGYIDGVSSYYDDKIEVYRINW